MSNLPLDDDGVEQFVENMEASEKQVKEFVGKMIVEERQGLMSVLNASIEAAVCEVNNLMAGIERAKEEYDGRHVLYEKLLAAVVKHHSAHADDLCWLDDNELYEAAGLPPRDNRINDPVEMMTNCKRFITQRCIVGGDWKSYAQLEEELKALESTLSDEEFSHRETLCLWNESKAEATRQATEIQLILQSREKLATEVDSLCREVQGLVAENKRLSALVKCHPIYDAD